VSNLEANSSWQYSVDAGATWSAGTGSSFTLAQGSYNANQVQVRVTDLAGNSTDSTATGNLIVDNAAPSASRISATGDATYLRNQVVTLVLQASEALYVTGTPKLALSLESTTPRFATYVSGSGTSSLTFQYTVASGDLDTNGIGISKLQLPTGTAITDLAGNAIDSVTLNNNLNNIANAQLTGVNVNGAVVGTAADGYLVGVVIFADSNNNNTIDAGEAVGGSIGPGVFSIPGGSGHLIMRGGSDISTGQDFSVQYEAPEGYLVVNPITTLISRVQSLGEATYYQFDADGNQISIASLSKADPNLGSVYTDFKISTETAQSTVLKALGISAVDFTTYDPFSEASKAFGSYTNLNVAKQEKLDAITYQKSAAMLATVADVGSSVFASVSSAFDTATASVRLVDEVAKQMVANPSISMANLLTDTAQLTLVVSHAAADLKLALTTVQAAEIAAVLAKANAVINAESTVALSSETNGANLASDALSVLRLIVAVQSSVQGDSVIQNLSNFVQGKELSSATSYLNNLINGDVNTAGSLEYTAAHTIVGPIVPSKFSIASDAPLVGSGSQAMATTYEGTTDGADRIINFTITRGGGLDGTVVLNYQITGSATLTADRFVGGIPSGQVTFGANETSKTISVEVANNQVVNPSELVTMVISDAYGNSQFINASGALTSNGSTQVMLLDDDPNTPVISGALTADVLAGSASAVPALSINYYNASAPLKVALSASHGQLAGQVDVQSDGTYLLYKLNGTTHEYTLTQAEANLILGKLTFSGEIGSVAGSVHLQVTPSGRTVSGSYDVGMVIHNPSTLSVVAQQNAVAATPSALQGITIADVDSSNLTVTLTGNGGAVSVGNASGAFVNQSATGALTLNGSSAALNAALGTLSFTATAGYSSASLKVTVNDGDALTPDPTATINLAVATAPSQASLPDQVMSTVGIPTLLTGITVQDPDSAVVTVKLQASAGTLSLGALSSGVVIKSQSAGVIELDGTPQALQQTLNAVSYLAPTTVGVAPVLSLSVDDHDSAHSAVNATPVNVTIIANQPPSAGGNVTATTPNNINGLVTEDTLTTVRIAPATLSNPDGPAPTQVRILSIEGGTLYTQAGSAIAMGASGQVLTLNAANGTALDLQVAPDLNRNTAIKISYAMVDPVLSTLNSAASLATVNLLAVNDAPVVALSPASVTFTEKGGAVAVMPALSISDVDNVTLSSARVSISTATLESGDLLGATLGTSGLTQSYDAAKGLLTLTGTASLDVYRQVLQTVAFNNTNAALLNGTRALTLNVTDASGDAATNPSANVSTTLQVVAVNDAPVVQPSVLSQTFAESVTTDKLSSKLQITPNLVLTDPDGSATVIQASGATIAFNAGYRVGQDILSVDTALASTLGITSSFDLATGSLTLAGNASDANYQALLRTVTYQNSSAAPSTDARQIVITVKDMAGAKGTQTVNVSVTPYNDASVVDLNGASAPGLDAAATSVGGLIPVAASFASLASLSDPDSTTANSLTITVTNATITDKLILSAAAKAAATSAGLTITGEGTSVLQVVSSRTDLLRTVSSYQSVLQGVQYSSVETSGTKSINVALMTDNTTSSAVAKIDLTPTPFAQVLTSTIDQASSQLVLAGSPSSTSFTADLSSSLVATASQRLSVTNLFKATQIDASQVDITGVTGSISLLGTTGDNIIVGTTGADLIVGGGGKDVLVGGAGADSFLTTLAQLHGTGTTIFGGTANYISASSSWAAGADVAVDTLQLQGDKGTLATADWSQLMGIDAVKVVGTGDFTLYANPNGSTALAGGTGNDTLISGGGVTTMTGGGGTNTFQFLTLGTTGAIASSYAALVSQSATAFDAITDLTVGDRIVLPADLTWLGVLSSTSAANAAVGTAWFDTTSQSINFRATDGYHRIVLPAASTTASWTSSVTSDGLQLTVLPAAPAAPSLAVASDTGYSALDGVTNAVNPAFVVSLSGTGALANNQIRLYADAKLVAVKVLTSSDIAAGQVQLAVGDTVTGVTLDALSLVQGQPQLTVAQWAPGLGVKGDGTGYLSSVSSALSTVQIDLTAPSAPGINLNSASDSGASASDGVTNVATPLVDVSFTPTQVSVNSKVNVLLAGQVVGSKLLTQQDLDAGKAQVSVSNLGNDGTKGLSANVTDLAGNVSTSSAALNITLDQTAPNAPTLSIASASDSGLKGDSLTNIDTPTMVVKFVSSQVSAGSVINITTATGQVVGTKKLTSTEASSGVAQVTVSSLGADGIKTMSATIADSAGNTSAASTALQITLDRVAPTAPTLVLDTASDTGVAGDNMTNSGAPQIVVTFSSAQVSTGSVLNIQQAGVATPIASLTLSSTDIAAGKVTLTTSDLGADGSKALTATLTDSAGNTSSGGIGLALQLDRTAPTAPTLALSAGSDSGVSGDGVTNVASPSVRVSFATSEVNAGTVIKLVSGTTVLATRTLTATEATAGVVDISTGSLGLDGAKSLAATLTDAAGNVSGASTALAFTLDTTAPSQPAVTLNTVSDSGIKGDSITSANTPSVHVAFTASQVTAGAVVNVLDGSGAVVGSKTLVGADLTAGAVDISTSSLGLDGAKSLTATLTDAAGNVSAASAALAFTLDTTAPSQPALTLNTVSDSGIKGDSITSANTPSVHVAFTASQVTAGAVVNVLDGSGAVVGSKTLVGADLTAGAVDISTSSLGLDGAKSLTATLTDAAGNVSGASAALAFTLDTTAPLIQSITTPAAGTYLLNAALSFDVNFSESMQLASGTTLQLQLNNGLTSSVVSATLASTQPVLPAANGSVTAARFVYILTAPDNAASVNVLGLNKTPQDVAGNNLSAYTWPTLNGVILAPTNAMPVWASAAAAGNVTESLSSADTLSTNGTVSFTDLNAADIHVVSASSLTQTSPLGALSVVKTSDSTGTGTGGLVTWNYTLANSAVQSFTAGQTQVDHFTVTLDDQHGGIVTKQVDITITGINTPAVINGVVSGAVTEAGGVNNASQAVGTSSSTSGLLTITDVDSTAAFQVVTTPATGHNAQYGDFTLSASGAWTYTLQNANSAVQALSEISTPLTDTITVYSVDGTSAVLTVTIRGSNDAPIISAISSPATIVDTPALDTFTPVTGVITASDVDAGQTLSYAIATGSGTSALSNVGTYGTLSVDAQGRYSYAVNAQAVNALTSSTSESFTIQVSDGSGGVTTQSVTFNITGVNDALVITNNASALVGNITETGNNNDGSAVAGTATATGTLSVSDVDANAVQSWSLQGTPSTTYGTMALDATGHWTYSLNNALSATQSLVAGQVVTQTYTVRASDTLGGYVEQVITVTIHGTNDAPTLTTYAAYPTYVYENGTTLIYPTTSKTTTVETGFADVDNLSQVRYVTTDDQGKVLWEKSGTSTYTRTGNFGVATLDTSTGNISYVLDDTLAETQSLKTNQAATDSFTVSVTDGLAVTTKTIGFDILGADDASAWSSTTAAAVQIYRYSGDRAVVRVELSAADVDSNQSYSATLTEGGFSTSFNLSASGGALIGLANLLGAPSASDYVLTLTASGGNTLTKTITGNTVGDAVLISPVKDLATGGNFNDLLLGSSFGDYLDFTKHPESHPTFLGNAANDVFDGLGAGMAFAGGAGNDTAILQDSTLQMTDSTGHHYYAISMLPTALAASLANDFGVSSTFANAIAQDGFAANQAAFVSIATTTGTAYTDAENLVFANSASVTGDVSTSQANDLLLGRDASNANALQLQLSDAGVRVVAGGHADNILGGFGNDVIVGNGNGNGALINGQAEAADILHGGAGNDILSGGAFLGLQNSSVDVSYLYGDQGDDVLVAVSGTVYATGGTGRDVFALFDNTDSVNLFIKDFNAATDRIDLSALTDLKSSVLNDPASSIDRSAALQTIMSSATTNTNGDLVLNLDAYLSADACAANHHASITVQQVSANDGQLSTQNFVFSEMAWSPNHWHDNLNPLV